MNSNNNNRYIGIWYNKIVGHNVIWVANRHQPINGTTGILSITTNGSLVITEGSSTIIWSFALMTQVINPIAQLLDTGNFIVTSKNDPDKFAWQSFDYPTDTLIPGMKLGWDVTSGLNRNLTGWSSSTDPSPGNYTLTVDRRGAPQLIFWAGSFRIWRSGPWTGVTPFNDPYSSNAFVFHFVIKKEEVSYSVSVVNNSILTRLVVNPSGIAERFVLLNSGQWGQYWYGPGSQCDKYGVCGPYGVCNLDKSPMCSCLPGYEPKFPDHWALMVYSGGCIRKTALDCRNGTDGFVTVQRILLPDTVWATVDTRMNLFECRVECLRNCSCSGYASADTHEGGSGCIFWFTELVDVIMYPTGGQDLYLRLAEADIGMYCLLILLSCLLVYIYFVLTIVIQCSLGEVGLWTENDKVSIVANNTF